MLKEFTVNVPDELWVDSWNDNNTATYTYEGPQNVYAIVSPSADAHIIATKFGTTSEEVDPYTDEEVQVIGGDGARQIHIDADVNPEFAEILVNVDHDAHTFEDEVNHDGSTHQKISNPHLSDWFELGFEEGDPDTVGLELHPIYKDTDNILLITAKSRKDKVKKYDDAYDFTADEQATIDTFMTTINAYITTVSTAYPWKYVSVNVDEVPKIPASLQLLFNQLPEID